MTAGPFLRPGGRNGPDLKLRGNTFMAPRIQISGADGAMDNYISAISGAGGAAVPG